MRLPKLSRDIDDSQATITLGEMVAIAIFLLICVLLVLHQLATWLPAPLRDLLRFHA